MLLVLGLLSLWSASHPFRYYPLQFPGELFFFDRNSERLSLPQAEPGRREVEMVLIPAGDFLAGNADERRGWMPRQIYLDAFHIDIHEVTNRQYNRFVEAINDARPPYRDDPRYNKPDPPVVGVSWYDARAYC